MDGRGLDREVFEERVTPHPCLAALLRFIVAGPLVDCMTPYDIKSGWSGIAEKPDDKLPAPVAPTCNVYDRRMGPQGHSPTGHAAGIRISITVTGAGKSDQRPHRLHRCRNTKLYHSAVGSLGMAATPVRPEKEKRRRRRKKKKKNPQTAQIQHSFTKSHRNQHE